MSTFYWRSVHQLLTSSLYNNDSKCIIFQVEEDNLLSKYIETNNITGDFKTYVKE